MHEGEPGYIGVGGFTKLVYTCVTCRCHRIVKKTERLTNEILEEKSFGVFKNVDAFNRFTEIRCTLVIATLRVGVRSGGQASPL